MAKLFSEAAITVLLGTRIKLARGENLEGIAALQRAVERVYRISWPLGYC